MVCEYMDLHIKPSLGTRSRFFYKNLLDADAALIHCHGDGYLVPYKRQSLLAREENIEKFSKFRFKDKQILAKRYKTKNTNFMNIVSVLFLMKI